MNALFSTLSFQLGQLVDMIDSGSIGLPEIQRPFVWKKTKVRDLFDSMYRGFPVGYFLFWRNSSVSAKQIGAVTHQLVADRMIVDGQQRLTSLYAVLKGVPVIGEDYRPTRIEIAFNPVTAEFAVTSAAHRRSPSWIADISTLWRDDVSLFSMMSEYLAKLGGEEPVTSELRHLVEQRVSRLSKLTSYQFTAIELSAETEAESVADIFVRINSAGVVLNQADFILTLMSVYWDGGRRELESFSRSAKIPQISGTPSPFNHFIDPSPAELLRVAIGYGFRRGRLRSVYNLLRGKEPDDSGNPASEAHFQTLRDAQAKVLNLSNWHQFLQTVMMAWFRSGRLITSRNTLVYAYVLFLIGKVDFGVNLRDLRNLIARWFFMSALTSRYSGTFESQIESDLNRLTSAADAAGFVSTLERLIVEKLTDDYWNITLPSELETTAARSPTLYAYYASLVTLRAQVLFSTLSVSDLLDPAVQGDRLAVERHHLFPSSWLKSQGIDQARDVDQIANFALVEWPDNASIGGKAPAEYAPPILANLPAGDRERHSRWHALPVDWPALPYREFLAQRRKLLAEVVRKGFECIGDYDAQFTDAPTPSDIGSLIAEGECNAVEFKSTARWSVRDGKVLEAVEHSIAKTIAAFLNAKGGTLLIGVADDRSIVGLEFDYATLQKRDRDGFELYLTDKISTYLGKNALSWVNISFERVDEKDVARVVISKSPSLVFLNPKGQKLDEVYVRFGNSTRRLTPAEMLQYMADQNPEGLPMSVEAEQALAQEEVPEGL